MNNVEILDKAIELVKGNWGKRAYVKENGEVCAVGAMIMAMNPEVTVTEFRNCSVRTLDGWLSKIPEDIVVNMVKIISEQYPGYSEPFVSTNRPQQEQAVENIVFFNDRLCNGDNELIAIFEKTKVSLEG